MLYGNFSCSFYLLGWDFMLFQEYFLVSLYNSSHWTSCAGKGSDPEWNETFLFTISEGVSELKIKIMDKDTLTDDDLVAEAT